ncbi:carbamoyl-phosphate synthase [Paenibacillus sp. Soil766]|nr:carbamoyl-phosphate synthase [Paenibacillus sp. Soil766]
MPLLNSLKKAICKLGDNRKIIGADVNPSCIGAYFVDKFWEMPRLSNLSIEDFVDYCKRNSINIVIPTRDGELAYFSEHQQLLLENEIYVMVSSPSSVEACLDKLKFYNELSKQGFPVIPTVDDISSINAVSYVVKERFGAGSKSIGIQLDGESATKHAKSLSSPIFQPFVQGREISVDLYIDKLGMVKGCVARERTYVVDGESQITETIRNQALEELCSNLAERLQLYGHVVMQVIIDSKGFFHIIECNSRFGGASSLSLEVGLDSFYWLILESSGYDLKDYPFLRLDVEKKLVRYSADVYF